jgi:D-alanyl-lipoteichoic acid acyltransferase DltB (MBOAT superfamily)
MAGASFTFLAFSLAVVLLYNLRQSLGWRQGVLLLASICFLELATPGIVPWLPSLAFLAFGYACIRLIEMGRTRSLALVVGLTIFFFVVLKKYIFVPSFFLLHSSYSVLGLSYILFRIIHLMVDAQNGALPARIGLVAYLTYTLNFTTLVSGPIQRFQDFAKSQLRSVPLPLTIFDVGEAIERIIRGMFKANVLALLFSIAQSKALELVSPSEIGHLRLMAGCVVAASYTLFLYCNFSGYIDIVIGIARLIRLPLPENFDRPFSADNFINFWSRWHITLSEWLKTYVYTPLVMTLMRRYPSRALEPFWAVLGFFVTFFLIGLWHGRTSEFIFFGVLQGLGVSGNKLYQIILTKKLGRKGYRALCDNYLYVTLCRGLTFTWFTFTLLWFWSNWHQLGALAHTLGTWLILDVWISIFIVSTIVLAFWEVVRKILWSTERNDLPLPLSRYVRTAWNTALLVIVLAVTMLTNQPAPEIVYKTF